MAGGLKRAKSLREVGLWCVLWAVRYLHLWPFR